jgi:hypothetical protein
MAAGLTPGDERHAAPEAGRFAPPAATLDADAAGREEPDLDGPPRLWNPTAALAWSLLFTPVFGAWLQAANWRALGQSAAARRSTRWAAGCAAALFVAATASMWLARRDPFGPVTLAVDLVLLLAWALGDATRQARALPPPEAGGWRRREWTTPLFLGLAGGMGLFVAMVVMETIATLVRGAFFR